MSRGRVDQPGHRGRRANRPDEPAGVVASAGGWPRQAELPLPGGEGQAPAAGGATGARRDDRIIRRCWSAARSMSMATGPRHGRQQIDGVVPGISEKLPMPPSAPAQPKPRQVPEPSTRPPPRRRASAPSRRARASRRARTWARAPGVWRAGARRHHATPPGGLRGKIRPARSSVRRSWR